MEWQECVMAIAGGQQGDESIGFEMQILARSELCDYGKDILVSMIETMINKTGIMFATMWRRNARGRNGRLGRMRWTTCPFSETCRSSLVFLKLLLIIMINDHTFALMS